MHYPMWTRLHKPIERYTALLESLSKVVEGEPRVSTGVFRHIGVLLISLCLGILVILFAFIWLKAYLYNRISLELFVCHASTFSCLNGGVGKVHARYITAA